MQFPVAERAALTFCSKVGELGRRVRPWPFDTLRGAFCTTFRALSDAPISVANGHDLTLIPSSPILEQKVSSPESAQVGKHKVLTLAFRIVFCPNSVHFEG